MRILKIKSKLNIAVLIIIGITVFMSCEKMQENPNDLINKQILDYAENVAKNHNECLDYIQLKLSKESLKTSYIYNKKMISIANDFISLNTENILKGTSFLSDSFFDTISVSIIKKEMTEKELVYVSKVEKNIYNNDSIAVLKEYALNDVELDELAKYKICTFICVAEASYKYWNNNSEKWKVLTNKNKLKNTSNAEAIFLSDAFYGWWGTLGSGGNVVIGAACAAVGSGMAYMQ